MILVFIAGMMLVQVGPAHSEDLSTGGMRHPVALAALVSGGSPCSSRLSPGSVVVRRTSHFHRRNTVNVSPFHRTIKRVDAVRKLYRAVCALRPPPSNLITSCLMGTGIVYQIGFYERGRQILHVNAPVSGCFVLFLWYRPWHNQAYSLNNSRFWNLLAGALGIRQRDLYPRVVGKG